MAFTAKILSWHFHHLNIVGCLLKRRATRGGSPAPQDPPPPPAMPLRLDEKPCNEGWVGKMRLLLNQYIACWHEISPLTFMQLWVMTHVIEFTNKWTHGSEETKYCNISEMNTSNKMKNSLRASSLLSTTLRAPHLSRAPPDILLTGWIKIDSITKTTTFKDQLTFFFWDDVGELSGSWIFLDLKLLTLLDYL